MGILFLQNMLVLQDVTRCTAETILMAYRLMLEIFKYFEYMPSAIYVYGFEL